MHLEIKRFQRIVMILMLLFVQQAAFGQTTGASLSEQAALVTELDVNGLKVIVKKRPGSATVAAGLFIRGGARNLTAQNAGIENFMLSTATEGSLKFPRKILRQELARTGGNISSRSLYDYSAIALASTRENFDLTWQMFTDVALRPAFAATDVELTREKLLTQLRGQEDDPDSHLQEVVDKTIFSRTPFENDPDGTVESVSRLSAADLRAYHKKIMETSRLVLVVVGDLDADQIKQMVTAAFGKTPRGTYKEAPVPPLDFSKPTLDITQRALPTNYINGIFAAPSLVNPDYSAMRVAISVLRERVFEEVRVKKNLSYAPSADLGSLSANTGAIYVTAVDANQSISLMLAEINTLKTTPLDKRTISGVTGQFLTNYFTGQETNAAQALELAKYELTGGGWRNAFEFLNRVKQVSPADVQRVSQKYMTNLRFVVVGNPASIDRSIFLQK
jgi:zinc protease